MIVRDVPQAEEMTCEVIRFTEKGNLNGKIACRKRGEAGNRLPYDAPQDLDDMGKARLLEVQWRVGDYSSLDTTVEVKARQQHLVQAEICEILLPGTRVNETHQAMKRHPKLS